MSLDSFLASIPKNILVFSVLAGGVLLIILMNPPHTFCDSQAEAFKNDHKDFLFLDSSKSLRTTTNYELKRDKCRGSNSPGGCLELFYSLNLFIQDLKAVSSECRSKIGGMTEVRRALWEALDLMVKLSWGSQPPSSYQDKFRWMDDADRSLFCEIKAAISLFYGDQPLGEFRERMFAELPGAQQLPRNEVWQRMLLSLNCSPR